MDVSQIYLELYKYELELEVMLPPHNIIANSIPFGTLKLSTYFYDIFIDMVIRNEKKYEKVAKVEEPNI